MPIGPMELVIILVIVLIIFGPKKVPELGNSLGRSIREFKSGLAESENQEATTKPVVTSDAKSSATSSNKPVATSVSDPTATRSADDGVVSSSKP